MHAYCRDANMHGIMSMNSSQWSLEECIQQYYGGTYVQDVWVSDPSYASTPSSSVLQAKTPTTSISRRRGITLRRLLVLPPLRRVAVAVMMPARLRRHLRRREHVRVFVQ